MAEGSNNEKEEFRENLRNYDYIRFSFADVHGISRGKLIPARHAHSYMEKGMPIFSGVQIFGPSNELNLPKRVVESKCENAFAVPDLKTLHSVPWAGDGKHRVGEVLCDVKWADGEYQGVSTRAQAAKQLKELDKMGFTLRSSMEYEMILLKRGTTKPVFIGSDYCCSFVMQEFETFVMDLDQTLQQIGVEMDCYHPEYASGQFEMVVHHQPGIKAPDNAFVFKQCVKEIAQKNGWDVNSMAKIAPDQAGSGAHFNFSVWDKETGKNAFYDEGDPNKISQVAKYWIGGIMKHCRALCALCSPTVNCYRRLHQPWAPDNVDWNFDDRTATLRVKNYDSSSTYMENRMPSGLCNPYLVLAGTLAAGLDGLKNKIEPPAPSQTDIKLPMNLKEALEALETDKEMVAALGSEFVEWFVSNKRELEVKKFDKISADGDKLHAERQEYAKLM